MTLAELCKIHKVHVTQINDWKKQLMARVIEIFSSGDRPDPVDLAPLHAKIGQLTLGMIFWKARSPRRDC